jgi:hypothetical protein
MPYLLPCECGHRLQVKKSQAGNFVDCPGCHRKLDVPTIGGLSKLEWIHDESSQSDVNKLLNRRWSPLRGFLAAACFVIALLGLGRSGWYGVYRYYHPTDYTVEDWMKLIDEESKTLSPAETWDTWLSIQESGLGDKKPPEPFIEKKFLEQQDTSMLRWAISGGLGLVGLMLTSLWRRKK